MNKLIATFLICLFNTMTYAQQDDAEALVAGKQKAEMTYRQLMEILGRASSLIHEGILRENKQMVKEGANIILNHPAPNHKPWLIMSEADREGFKQSLLSFDKILDTHAARAVKQAEDSNWIEASNALNELNSSCISCHAMWRNKVMP